MSLILYFSLKTHELTAVSYFNWPPLVPKRTCDLIYVTSTMVVVNVTPLHHSLSPALPTTTTTDVHRHPLLSKVSKTVKYSLTYWPLQIPATWQRLPHCYHHINHSDDPQWCISTTYNPQTRVSNPIHTSQPFSNLFWPPTTLRHTSWPLSNLFQPPTTPRHVFWTLDTHLDPSVACFDHLQPSDTGLDPLGLSNPFQPPATPRHMFQTPDMHLNPSATFFDHLQPSWPLIQSPDTCFKPQTCVSTLQQPISMPLTHSCTPGPKMHIQLYVCFFIYIYCSYIAVITSYNTYLKTD